MLPVFPLAGMEECNNDLRMSGGGAVYEAPPSFFRVSSGGDHPDWGWGTGAALHLHIGGGGGVK